jgi:hypothetical protein
MRYLRGAGPLDLDTEVLWGDGRVIRMDRRVAGDTSNGTCKQCNSPRPTGCTVTCGKSECQEAEFHDNATRAKTKRRKAGAR